MAFHQAISAALATTTPSPEPTPEPKACHGSCHCKAIQYTATVTLHPSKTSKCNCTICLKTGYFFEQPTAFTLISPSSNSEISGDYTFGKRETHHYFCKECGVRVFIEYEKEFVDYGDGKGQRKVVNLNLHTLDDADLSAVELQCRRYEEGRNETWKYRDTPWEGGAW